MTNRVLGRVGEKATAISAIMLNAIFVLFLIGIIARRIPSISDPGATELATAMGIWIVYLTFVSETLSLRHIKVDYFVNQLDDTLRRKVILFGLVLGAVTTFILFLSSILVTLSYTRGTTPSLDLPRYLLSIPLLFGFGLGSVAFALKALDHARGEI